MGGRRRRGVMVGEYDIVVGEYVRLVKRYCGGRR